MERLPSEGSGAGCTTEPETDGGFMRGEEVEGCGGRRERRG